MLSTINLNPSISDKKRPNLNIRSRRDVQTTSISSNQPAFGAGFVANPVLAFNVLPKLNDPNLKESYIALYKEASPQGKADLKFLLDTGKLLSADADDGTTTIHNLTKIIREPRAKGLDARDILNSALRALANPYSITQDFGNISSNVANTLMQHPEVARMSSAIGIDPTASQKPFFTAKNNVQQPQQKINLPQEMNVDASGTCVAASMEFNLADKRPAEFARYAAELSSPKLAVVEDFKFSDIDEDQLNAMYWLDQFKVQYEANDFDGGKILLKPDNFAIFRAISQTQNRKPGTRSALDSLMQSTFMQLGSAQSYNSLTDIRTGGFNQSNRGLTELEKSMAEAIIDDNGGKSSVTYQIVDDNAYLVGYTKNYQQTLMDIINSLKAGFNVIVGITETDANAKITGGHEITIVASKIGKDGKLYFVCNDTDDNLDTPIEIPAEELIPKVHHAGIPNKILNNIQQTAQQRPIMIQIPPQIQAPATQQISQQYANSLNSVAANKTFFMGNENSKIQKSNMNIVA